MQRVNCVFIYCLHVQVNLRDKYTRIAHIIPLLQNDLKGLNHMYLYMTMQNKVYFAFQMIGFTWFQHSKSPKYGAQSQVCNSSNW